MSKQAKDRMMGVVVTILTSLIMFLSYSYMGSFETRASAENKYSRLDKKVSLILCLLDKKHCLKGE